MSAPTILNADPRTRIGHANVKLAPLGLVPAVVYGPKTDPQAVSLSLREFEAAVAAHGATMLADLKIAGSKKPVQVLVREIQRNPITRTPIHVDLLAVDASTPVTVAIPLVAAGEPVGVRMESGVFNVELHEVMVEALPADLPERIEYDVTEMAVGDVVVMGDIAFPEGVTPLAEKDAVVCSVMAPHLAPEASLEEAPVELVGESDGEQ